MQLLQEMGLHILTHRKEGRNKNKTYESKYLMNVYREQPLNLIKPYETFIKSFLKSHNLV